MLHSLSLLAGSVILIFLLASYAVLRMVGTVEPRGLAAEFIVGYLLAWGLYALVSKVAREELQQRFMLMTVSVTVFIALIEAPAFLGFVDYRQVFPTSVSVPPWDQPGYRTDEELLYLPLPHHRRRITASRGNFGAYLCLPSQAHPPYDLRYDQHGFRNEMDVERADTAVIGDSVVEGQQVPSAALMTTVLGQWQNRTVANLGVSGYGPQQELAVLKRYALALRPQTIVWVFYEGNDLTDVQAYEQVVRTRQYVQTVWKRSFIRNALGAVALLSQGCQPHPVIGKHYGTIQEAHKGQRRVFFTPGGISLSPSDLDALNTTRSILAEAYQLCREQGSHLVVVFAPTEFRVYHDLPMLLEVSEATRSWIVNDLPVRLSRIMATISPEIAYLDLTPAFKEAAQQGVPIFLPDDNHWAHDGHAIAGQAIHAVLSSGRS